MRELLDKYDTVIFDMDGVITSEQSYWSCAALTVWEHMHMCMGEKVDAAECMANLRELREKIFCGDRLITVLKGKGVNSNWDLGYVTELLAWIVNGRDKPSNFEAVLEYARALPENILDAYAPLAEKAHEATGYDTAYLERNGLMWQTMYRMFQGWFLGDGLAAEQGIPQATPGKPGLVYAEMPLMPVKTLHRLLAGLCGKRAAIGTGRPGAEIIEPLKGWDVLKYFAPDGICHYDYVAAAETETGETLTKPHPYMFLKALYGTDYEDARLLAGDYDRSKISKTLVVGDAGADILAAKAMGADFCAVLTGVNGAAARGYFETMGAEYILDSAADLIGDK